jgi:hypothetical protein
MRQHNKQGDQIGQIFAHWVIVYFWQFFSTITKVARIFCAAFSTVKFMN